METVFLASLVFAPLAFACAEPWSLALLQITVFSLAFYRFAKPLPFQPAQTDRNLLPALLAVAALGLFQSLRENPVNAPSALLFTVWRPASFNAVLLWLFYGAVLFSVPRLLDTPGRFKRFVWAVFILGVALSLYGMLQKTGQNTMVYGLRLVKGEPFGPFVNRDHAATFLIMSASCGAGIFISGFRGLFSHQSRKRFFDRAALQFLKAVMLCAVVAGVVKTGSRGGLHSLAAAASLMAFVSSSFLRGKGPRTAARLGTVLFLAGYAVLLYNNRILLGFRDGELVGSVTVRFSMYLSGLEMLRDFPLFGVGLGAVEHAFPYYQREQWGLVRHVHSDWLELFLQVGFVGGLIYLSGLAAALRRAWLSWRSCPSFSVKSLSGGALGAVLAASLHNLVEFGSQMPANALVFYALLGALACRPAVDCRSFRYDAEPDESGPPPLKRPAALAGAAAALLCAALAVPQAVGWWYDLRARSAPEGEKPALRAAALNWAPSPRYAFRLGADLYNAAQKNKDGSAAGCRASLAAIEPYLLRVPVNHDLSALRNTLLLRLSGAPVSAPKRP